MPNDVAIITCFFNPVGFQSLRSNYDRFREGLGPLAEHLYTVELVLGNETPTITGPNVFQVRGESVLFCKENLLNLALAHVPSTYDKIAFVDCDLIWDQSDWLDEASRLLDRRGAVQLFSSLVDLDGLGNAVRRGQGIAYQKFKGGKGWARPGGAWAVHRQMLEMCGGLFDSMVIGSGDMVHTHLGFLGRFDEHWFSNLNPKMKCRAEEWALRVWRYVRGDIASVTSAATHLFHGSREDRKYAQRNRLLVTLDPDTWLRKNGDGVLEWTQAADPLIIAEVRKYFLDRREDDRKPEKVLPEVIALPKTQEEWLASLRGDVAVAGSKAVANYTSIVRFNLEGDHATHWVVGDRVVGKKEECGVALIPWSKGHQHGRDRSDLSFTSKTGIPSIHLRNDDHILKWFPKALSQRRHFPSLAFCFLAWLDSVGVHPDLVGLGPDIMRDVEWSIVRDHFHNQIC